MSAARPPDLAPTSKSGAVQLRLGADAEGLRLDPYGLANLNVYERIEVYRDLGLTPEQREAAETAVRLVLAGTYETQRGRHRRLTERRAA